MQQPTPNATTISSGPRRAGPLVAVAEIGERQHRDRVDHPEGDDRQNDRLEPDADTAELSQDADLDHVVEAEGEYSAARRGRANRGKAASLVGALPRRKQPVPAACTEDEAGQVREPGSRGKQRANVRERPARVSQPPRDEDGSSDGEQGKGDAGH